MSFHLKDSLRLTQDEFNTRLEKDYNILLDDTELLPRKAIVLCYQAKIQKYQLLISIVRIRLGERKKKHVIKFIIT